MTTMEILKLALMNTLLGMGTVFLVLIFMSWIISGFKYLPKLVGGCQDKEKGKGSVDNINTQDCHLRTQIVSEGGPSQLLGNQSQLIGNKSQLIANQSQEVSPEIVAVITAAIMSFSKQTGDQYVVRGIRRAKQHRNFIDIDNKINEDINW